MKRNLSTWIKGLSIALVLAMCLTTAPVSCVFAAGNTAEASKTAAKKYTPAKQPKSFKVEVERVWARPEGSFVIQVPEKELQSKVTFRLDDEKAAEVKLGGFDAYGYALVDVKAMKTGEALLTVSLGSEKFKVQLILAKKKSYKAEKVFDNCYDAVVEIGCIDAGNNPYIGTGFFVGDRLLLTAYHVVDSATKILIVDYNEKSYTIDSVVAYDEASDLILFRTVEQNDDVLTRAAKVLTGEEVYALGSPLGYSATFSRGNVSRAKRELDGYDYVQVTVPTSVGSGGGPIINRYGQYCGIITLTVTAGQNLNFALETKYVDNLKRSTASTLMEQLARTAGKYKISQQVYNASIIKEKGFDSSSGVMDEKTPEDIYAYARGAMVEIMNQNASGSTSTGSGWFMDQNLVVSNYHVIKNAVNLTIKDYSGNAYTVTELVDFNEEADCAILRVKEPNYNVLLFDSRYVPKAGEKIYTLGSPLYYTDTFSSGIVSASTRVEDGVSYIQMDAPVTSGNSGGPLFNKYGIVIGINTLSYTENQGMSFALKISYLADLDCCDPMDINDFYRENRKNSSGSSSSFPFRSF